MQFKGNGSKTCRSNLAIACPFVLAVLLSFTVTGFGASPTVSSVVARDNNLDGLAALNLPEDFLQKIRRRGVLDQYSARVHTVETQAEPGVLRSLLTARSSEQAIRTVRPEIPESVFSYRQALEAPVHAFRGFRAPILDEMNDLRPVVLPKEGLPEKERRAAEVIRKSLAFDGLLVSLSQTIEILGPEKFATNSTVGTRQLRDLGLPIDLLPYFRFAEAPMEPAGIISHIAGRLLRGESAASLKQTLQEVRFSFFKTRQDFRAAEEAGEVEIGLVRLQIGSGYHNGIIRGGIIDVAGQLIGALPQADFLVTAADDYFDNIRWLAQTSWRLRRPASVTLISERGPVRAWAQDNGKAGLLSVSGGTNTVATLVPRYASQDEVNSPLFAGESFLMDGLRAAGHEVLHSPLLFQGGNLMVVRDPFHNERLLLLSETELYRNVALGLTREQALEAFRFELGVDKCVVLPAVSYHLDYDLTVRKQEGEIIAFVNDTDAAARLIVQRAITALEDGGVMSKNAADEARQDLARNEISHLCRSMAAACRPFLNENQQYRHALVRLFGVEATDSKVFNFQCFLAALDILASQNPQGDDSNGSSTNQYFAGLRELETAARTQQENFKKLGWKIVRVPSMPDLDHSLNYLNGLQDRSRYLMPAMGGFYNSLDHAAAQAFQKALGEKVRIVRIFNPEAQQKHGGVHCVAAAYPRIQQAAGPAKSD